MDTQESVSFEKVDIKPPSFTQLPDEQRYEEIKSSGSTSLTSERAIDLSVKPHVLSDTTLPSSSATLALSLISSPQNTSIAEEPEDLHLSQQNEFSQVPISSSKVKSQNLVEAATDSVVFCGDSEATGTYYVITSAGPQLSNVSFDDISVETHTEAVILKSPSHDQELAFEGCSEVS